jgi:hypothetical protein
MDQGLAAIASALIGGIFVIIGAVISKASNASLTSSSGIPPVPGIGVSTTAPTLSFGRILIHIGVIQFVLQALGVTAGIALGVVVASSQIDIDTLVNLAVLVALIAGSLGLVIAFIISGSRVIKAQR